MAGYAAAPRQGQLSCRNDCYCWPRPGCADVLGLLARAAITHLNSAPFRALGSRSGPVLGLRKRPLSTGHCPMTCTLAFLESSSSLVLFFFLFVSVLFVFAFFSILLFLSSSSPSSCLSLSLSLSFFFLLILSFFLFFLLSFFPPLLSVRLSCSFFFFFFFFLLLNLFFFFFSFLPQPVVSAACSGAGAGGSRRSHHHSGRLPRQVCCALCRSSFVDHLITVISCLSFTIFQHE